MAKLNYETYLDKIYGCFLGKTVIGTLGAPYEGIKMPLELPFKPEMINTMLPNDDLDLQVLWLDVAEKYGPDFTSDQLLDRFVNFCDYSPGEYGIMRKNYMRGVHAPVSGSFCNDFYGFSPVAVQFCNKSLNIQNYFNYILFNAGNR